MNKETQELLEINYELEKELKVYRSVRNFTINALERNIRELADVITKESNEIAKELLKDRLAELEAILKKVEKYENLGF